MIPATILPLLMQLGAEAFDLISKAINAKAEEHAAIAARLQAALDGLRGTKASVHLSIEARDALTKSILAGLAGLTPLIPDPAVVPVV